MPPLEGPRRKVERANKHIADLVDLIERFRDSNPYSIVGECDVQTREVVGRARENGDPFPEACASLIAGDAIHNLRSALDLLYCAFVVANGKTITKKDSFPIAGSENEFKRFHAKVKRRIATEPATLIKDLKPYKGGNDGFWRLHRLDITDKHRLLLTAAAQVQHVEWRVSMPAPDPEEPVKVFGMKVGYTPTVKRRIYDGAEVFRVATEPDQEIQFRFEVSLDEPGIVESEPLIPLLNQFSGGTSRVIELFASLP